MKYITVKLTGNRENKGKGTYLLITNSITTSSYGQKNVIICEESMKELLNKAGIKYKMVNNI